MRVFLIQALSLEEASPLKVYPLGIVTLATHLARRGIAVKLLDLNVQPDAFAALVRELREFQPDAIGISFRNIDPLANKTSSLVPPFKATIKIITGLLPAVPIIAGGTGYSLFPERILAELPEISYGLAGESEQAFVTLLESLGSSTPSAPASLPGLYLRKDGQPAPCSNISHARYDNWARDYLWPDRTLLDPRPYLAGNSYVPAIGIETQRGCPYHCAYCVYPKLQGNRVRARAPEDVVDEIEYLQKTFGIQRVHLNDPVVNMLPGHLESIAELLLARRLHIQWGGFLREDLLDDAGLLARSGCECFAFSPDAMHNQGFAILGKDMNTDDLIAAARKAAATDVTSIYHFMVNLPKENADTVAESRELMTRLFEIHKPRRNLGTIILNNMRIYPGTPIAKIAQSEAVIDESTDLLYPTYYNPRPYHNLRYELEALQLEQNIKMWQGI